jgi:CheY-like chemotaxis protein
MPSKQAAATAREPPVEGGSETILVVEDDPLGLTYAAARVKNLGYLVLQAANAAEAIAIVERGVRFDLPFTDAKPYRNAELALMLCRALTAACPPIAAASAIRNGKLGTSRLLSSE